MKTVGWLLCILIISSCNDAENKPVVQSVPQKNDTNLISKEMGNPLAPTDISPIDISYYPPDYPVKKMSQTGDPLPVVRIIYSRPHKQGRKIFGSLIKYGEPWRMGANEATEIEFFRPVTIQGKKVDKGRYILYCIPDEKEWTIIFNKNIYSWGLKQDPQKDIHKFQVPVQTTNKPVEYYTMFFQKSGLNPELLIAWDDVETHLPITL
jgi:hypothetical protein